MPFKLLTTADLHLGKKSSSVPRRLEESSTRLTWQRIVEWAVDNTVDAVVLVGDIVDRDNRFFEAIGPIQLGFEQLKKAAIQVIIVAGNHDFDVLPDIIRNKKYDHVHLVGDKGTWETITLKNDKGDLQFVGWSFPRQYVREDPSIQEWSAGLDPNLPTVGLLHGDINDANSKYAPVNINNLISDSVDAWVLGHIHKPEIYRESDPLIFYPGSPHALSSKEPRCHGPHLLTIDGRDEVTIQQIPLSPIWYETLEIDISGVGDESEFRNCITGRLTEVTENRAEELEQVSRLVFDLVLTGQHGALSELEQWSQLADQFEQKLLPETIVSIRTIVNRAEPTVDNLQQLSDQPTPPGILSQAILDLQAGRDSEFLDQLEEKIGNEINNINMSNTYQPLRLQNEELMINLQDTREYLLKECQHLLGALLSQKGNSDF